MIVHQVPVGNMQNFTYILEDENTSEGIIIDPSWELDEIMRIVQKNNIKTTVVQKTVFLGSLIQQENNLFLTSLVLIHLN